MILHSDIKQTTVALSILELSEISKSIPKDPWNMPQMLKVQICRDSLYKRGGSGVWGMFQFRLIRVVCWNFLRKPKKPHQQLIFKMFPMALGHRHVNAWLGGSNGGFHLRLKQKEMHLDCTWAVMAVHLLKLCTSWRVGRSKYKSINEHKCMHACRFSSAQGLPHLFQFGTYQHITNTSICKALASGPGPEATIFLPKKLQPPNPLWSKHVWAGAVFSGETSKQWKTVSNACKYTTLKI